MKNHLVLTNQCCRSCPQRTELRRSQFGTLYHAEVGQFVLHMCEEYLDDLRARRLFPPRNWKRIPRDVADWKRRDPRRYAY